jgi:hypothetical protein
MDTEALWTIRFIISKSRGELTSLGKSEDDPSYVAGAIADFG